MDSFFGTEISKSSPTFVVECSGRRFYLSQNMVDMDAPNRLSTVFILEPRRIVLLDADPDIFALIVAYMRGHIILPFVPTCIPKHLNAETLALALLKEAKRLELYELVQQVRNLIQETKDPKSLRHQLVHYAVVDGLLVGQLRLPDLREFGARFKNHAQLGIMYKELPTEVMDHFGHSGAILELHATFATVRFWTNAPLKQVFPKTLAGMPVLQPMVSVRFATQMEDEKVAQLVGKQSTIGGVPVFPLPYTTLGLNSSDRTDLSQNGDIRIVGTGEDHRQHRRRHSSAVSRGSPVPHASSAKRSGYILEGRGVEIGGSEETAAAWDFEMQIDDHTYTLREVLIFAQCLQAVNAATQKAVKQAEYRELAEAATNLQPVRSDNRVRFSPASTGKLKSRRWSLHGPAAAAAAGVPNATKDTPSGSPPRSNPFRRVFGGGSPSSSSSSDRENSSNDSHDSSATSVSKGPATTYTTATTAEPTVTALSTAKETVEPLLSTAIATGLTLGLNYAESLRISEIMDTDIDASELIFRIVPVPGENRLTLRLVKLVGTTKRRALYKTPFLGNQPDNQADEPLPDEPTDLSDPIIGYREIFKSMEAHSTKVMEAKRAKDMEAKRAKDMEAKRTKDIKDQRDTQDNYDIMEHIPTATPTATASSSSSPSVLRSPKGKGRAF